MEVEEKEKRRTGESAIVMDKYGNDTDGKDEGDGDNIFF